MDLWANLDELRRRRSEKWRRYPSDVLPLFVAEMDSTLAEPIRTALTTALDNSDTGYAQPDVLPEAYAGFAGRRWGWHPDPGSMTLMPDVARAARTAIELSSEPGDAVVINPPVYPPFYEWLEMTGRRLVPSPLRSGPDGWRLDLDDLEATFADGARVYLLCNPQNPTGTVHTRAELDAVAQLAEQYGVCVVSDEIHAPLTLGDARFTPFLSLDRPAAHHGFAAVSTSKAWNLAGLKTALLLGGDEVVGKFERIPDDVWSSTGNLGVIASVAALEECEAWLDELRAALEVNRRWLAEALAPLGVGYRPPDATYLAWLDFRDVGLGDEPASVLLERGRVALYRGLDFGPEGAGFARLNLATSPEILAEGVARITAAL
ncbi:MalY/PatB family protein [Cryptosporangium aurantiacum]|uniref:cysteine-S-conjugate beta-lyase n=1 Tax=Cryptosporangium aurantiacum TaxID=134849 RepID=A0A1M7RH84_9ACTN|nr:aminotransferase class I/II-fold pyridoxal phosphate-dependent enzyme [Cryptosporangium aurantiacum]SHN45590.1 cystathione beta-lyase [Cryptosporangium aurantiacum]